MSQVRANGIQLEYESFGDERAPAVLLIMGLGVQMIYWPDDFCRRIADAGYRVIRFDNRDIGQSERMDHLGKVDVLRAGLRKLFGLKVQAPYLLDDMAQDSVGLLDALGIERAHIIGLSMGGMIGQIIAAKYPQRTLSFTCIMSTSGARGLKQPSLRIQARLGQRPKKLDRESLIAHSMETWRLIGSPAFPTDAAVLRDVVSRALDRGVYPKGIARQTVAILASPSRVPLLKTVTAPTLVIHGAQDPLVPLPGGQDVAKHIKSARIEIIDGMGHDLPPQLMPRIGDLILDHLKHAA